jgi:HSP20-like domain found in ArsA
VRGPDLLVRVRDATRIVALPGSVAGRAVRRARLETGVLTVDFE